MHADPAPKPSGDKPVPAKTEGKHEEKSEEYHEKSVSFVSNYSLFYTIELTISFFFRFLQDEEAVSLITCFELEINWLI